MTRPMQLFLGFAFMVFGPFWASVVQFMLGTPLGWVLAAYFFGFGLSLVLFGLKWILCFGIAVAFGLVAFGLLSLTGSLA